MGLFIATEGRCLLPHCERGGDGYVRGPQPFIEDSVLWKEGPKCKQIAQFFSFVTSSARAVIQGKRGQYFNIGPVEMLPKVWCYTPL